MSESLKIKVDFDSEDTKALLQFITETQEGKYTVKKPDLTQVTYKRLEIQEQDKSQSLDNAEDEIILFGIGY